MNVKQIIKDNDIKEVYSVLHGIDVSIRHPYFDDLFDDGSMGKGGECIIFPSKEERNWDRFKPKEPTYKPCESVKQFADLFLGAKVKHKRREVYQIVLNAKPDNFKGYWFDDYTLIDGTPLGIKCDE